MIRVSIVVLIAAILAVGVIAGAKDPAQAPTPLVRALEPSEAKAGDWITATGTNLDKAVIKEAYLTQGEKSFKVETKEHADGSFKFRVPDNCKGGRFGLDLLTPGDPARIISEPVSLSVE